MKRRFPVTGTVVLLAALAAWPAMAAARAPRPIDWAALNPAFQGATFVKDTSVCLGCHEDAAATYQHTTHARTFKAEGVTALDRLDCEACHGPRSKHVENPGHELSLSRIPAAGRSQICLQCHSAGKNQMHWQSSAHSAGDLACDSCHTVMERRSDAALLKTKDQTELCYSCHAETRGQMQKSSHHPVREGKMTCASCHNPHGSTGPAMLRRASVTDTCQGCHQDKRGPFLWEHPPARENCATCHSAHGSNNRSMLVAKAQFLCLQCHNYGGHINVPRYNRTSTPTQQGCINCHVTPHGSNHPSGAKLTR